MSEDLVKLTNLASVEYASTNVGEYNRDIPFGEIIHRMRLLTGSSFRMIRDYMGPGKVSTGQLFRIELGVKRIPDMPVLERLEYYFKFPPSFMYTLWGKCSGQQSSERAKWDALSFFRNICADPNSESSLLIENFIFGLEQLTYNEAHHLADIIADPVLGKP